MGYCTKLLILGLIFSVFYHLIVSPYTKVEESFNLQACYDMLNYGLFPQKVVLHNYDHIEFPGVVPRTFIGSLILSSISQPILAIKSVIIRALAVKETTQILSQYVLRGLLGILNIAGFLQIKQSLELIVMTGKQPKRRPSVGNWYLAFLLTQFHLLYYSTRTLPNFIVLPLISFAFSLMLRGNYFAFMLFAFSGIVFRLEVGILGTIATFCAVVFQKIDPLLGFLSLSVGAIIGLCLTMLFDSYMWGYFVIPELSAFAFNVLEGKSAEWGTEPWHFYFSKYLLQLFRNPVILLISIFGVYAESSKMHKRIGVDRVAHPSENSLASAFATCVLYIIVMSIQPHKEWRFIVYVCPIICCLAANGISLVDQFLRSPFLTRVIKFVTLGSIIMGILLSVISGYISSFNYPGGIALQSFNQLVEQNSNITNGTLKVHIDVPACMSGVSKFGEIDDTNFEVVYDRTENEEELASIFSTFDYLISDVQMGAKDGAFTMDSIVVKFHEKSEMVNWKLLEVYYIFDGITIAPLIEFYREFKRVFISSYFGWFNIDFLLHFKSVLKSCIKVKEYLYLYEKIQNSCSQ